MTTCESCCREFNATRRSRDCPHCGYNNGRGSWSRSDDPAGVAATTPDDKRFRGKLRRKKRAAQAKEASAHA